MADCNHLTDNTIPSKKHFEMKATITIFLFTWIKKYHSS